MSGTLPDDVIWKLWEQSISDTTDCEFTRLSHIAAFAQAAITADRSARDGEAVAVVGTGFQLLWTGGRSFAEHSHKHGIKVGTKLYTAPADRGVPAGYRLLKDSTFDERSWPEDYIGENGSYTNTCYSCLRTFRGHKRRASCKVCAAAPQPTPKADAP